MEHNFSVGQRIRELRKQNYLSQEQLALATEITTAYLGQIERNEKNPTVAVVEKICGALGIGLAEFFSEKELPEKDSIMMQIFYLLKNESQDVKIIILNMVKQALKLKKI